MATALPLPGLSSQTHQGVGARFVSRIGGALRNAFAGLTRPRRQRRPAAPPPNAGQPAARDPENSPAPPRRRRAPRPSPTPPPAPSPRPGWIASWFGLRRNPPAASRHQAVPDSHDGPITPEAYPHLTPEVCALLNTPVAECDPELLRLTLAVFVRHLAESLPPELGQDAQALFATFWDRLGAPLSQEAADAPPPDQPDAPSGSADAIPDTPSRRRCRTSRRKLWRTARRASPPPEAVEFRPGARCRNRACAAADGCIAAAAPVPAERGATGSRFCRRRRRFSYAACAGPP